MAVDQPAGFSPGNTIVPRMESEPDGNLVAVFQGEDDAGSSSKISYSWNKRGTKLGDGYSFKLQIPRAPQAKFYFSMPSDISLTAPQGVLRELLQAPVEASVVSGRNATNEGSETNGTEGLRWRTDAGGLDEVSIRTRSDDINSSLGSFVIRSCEMQYEAQRLGLSWTCKMVVQVSDAWPLPELFIGDALVTSIEIDNRQIQFSKSSSVDHDGQLELGAFSDIDVAVNGLLDVVVTGHSRWNGAQGWCGLPMPVWVGDAVLHAAVVDEARLSVREPLQILNWELPEDWQWKNTSTETDVTTVEVEGPALTARADDFPLSTYSELMAASQWSRVRLFNRAVYSRSETALQLNVVDGQLRARARMEIKVDSNRLEPVQLLVQAGWGCQSISWALGSCSGIPESSRIPESARKSYSGLRTTMYKTEQYF